MGSDPLYPPYLPQRQTAYSLAVPRRPKPPGTARPHEYGASGPKTLQARRGRRQQHCLQAPFACSRNRSPMGRHRLKRQRNAPTVLVLVHRVHLLCKKKTAAKRRTQGRPKGRPDTGSNFKSQKSNPKKHAPRNNSTTLTTPAARRKGRWRCRRCRRHSHCPSRHGRAPKPKAWRTSNRRTARASPAARRQYRYRSRYTCPR
jgi:hypothetical protein